MQTKFTNKSVRLLLLWLRKQLTPDYSNSDYIAETGVDKSIASHDIREDYPLLDDLIAQRFPALKEMVGVLFRPEWLTGLPVVGGLGEKSEMTVTITVNHETGKMCWKPFTQRVMVGDEVITTVRNLGGSKLT